MCKAVNKHMRIGGIQVVKKIGGKRDFTLDENKQFCHNGI